MLPSHTSLNLAPLRLPFLQELNTLVAGQCQLDEEEWRAAARHEGGCEHTPQLAWFWALVRAAASVL